MLAAYAMRCCHCCLLARFSFAIVLLRRHCLPCRHFAYAIVSIIFDFARYFRHVYALMPRHTLLALTYAIYAVEGHASRRRAMLTLALRFLPIRYVMPARCFSA